MAVTIIGVQQANVTAGTTVTSPSLGASSVGDVLVLCASILAGATLPAASDNGGNTWTHLGGRGDATAATHMYYAPVTTANAAATATFSWTGSEDCSIVAWLIRGAPTYNGDTVNSANFSGTSTAWTVGPTTPAPAAGSIFVYSLMASSSGGGGQPGCPDATGYNITGSNGFTTGMKTNAHQESIGTGRVPCITAYKISSSVETPSVALPVASDWFGIIASFGPTATNGGTATGVANATAAGQVRGAGTGTGVANATAQGAVQGSGAAAGVANASAGGAVMLGSGTATGSANATAQGSVLGAGTATGVANASATASGVIPVTPPQSVGSGAWIPLQGHPNPNSRRHGGLNRKQRRIIKRDLLRTGFGDTDARDVDKDLGQDSAEQAREIAAIAPPEIGAIEGAGNLAQPTRGFRASEFTIPADLARSDQHWLTDDEVEALIYALAS